jgi:hypothetical protein
MEKRDARPRRINFFDGRLLTAADLRAEQAYARERQWLHHRLLHGTGVVHGLDVGVEGGELRVSPGLAVDGCGRLLTLPDAVSVEVPPPGSGEPEPAERMVVVEWLEEAEGAIPTPTGPEPDRFVETTVVSVRPARTERDAAVVLARLLHRRRTGWVVADAPPRRSPAGPVD